MWIVHLQRQNEKIFWIFPQCVQFPRARCKWPSMLSSIRWTLIDSHRIISSELNDILLFVLGIIAVDITPPRHSVRFRCCWCSYGWWWRDDADDATDMTQTWRQFAVTRGLSLWFGLVLFINLKELFVLYLYLDVSNSNLSLKTSMNDRIGRRASVTFVWFSPKNSFNLPSFSLMEFLPYPPLDSRQSHLKASESHLDSRRIGVE